MNQPTELPPTDLLLLERIASGDRASFDLFVTRMERLVYSTVYKVLNDRQDTEDVSQEVFFQVWQKAGLYNAQRGKPTTWVATMARNRAIDKIRHKQRQSRLLDGMQLSTEQRQAIELAYFKGLTQSEIAGQLNQPLGTVKARIRRGMVKLRERVVPSLQTEAD